MRPLTMCVLSLAVPFALTAPTVADAQQEGPYVRGAVGTTMQGRAQVNAPPLRGRADTGRAVSADLALGYDFGNGFRAEGAYSRLPGDLQRTGTLGGNAGTLNVFSVNGYYDFNQEGSWRPFVGAGVGFTSLDVGRLSLPGRTTPLRGDSRVAVGQVTVGISYVANDQLTYELGVRQLRTGTAEIGRGATRVETSRQATTVQIGARYRF